MVANAKVETIILAQYKTALYKRDIIVIEIEVLE
jgi:hypothetical protein